MRKTNLLLLTLSLMSCMSCTLLLNPIPYLVSKDKATNKTNNVAQTPQTELAFDSNTTYHGITPKNYVDYEKCESIEFFAPQNIGFDDDFVKKMYANFVGNLNWNETGAVIAANDAYTPGGDYRYNWMRDAG